MFFEEIFLQMSAFEKKGFPYYPIAHNIHRERLIFYCPIGHDNRSLCQRTDQLLVKAAKS